MGKSGETVKHNNFERIALPPLTPEKARQRNHPGS